MPQNPDQHSFQTLWQILANAVLATLTGLFAFTFVTDLQAGFRLSVALLLIKTTLDAVFFLIRKFPRETSISFVDWAIAIVATTMVVLLRPAGEGDLLVLTVVQVIGTVWEVVAILFLNRSFGIVPANRGVKKGGLYRVVRHPLYLGYVIALTGFVLNNLSATNVAILVTWMCLVVFRIKREEVFLARDADYVAYRTQVQWKLIPFVF